MRTDYEEPQLTFDVLLHSDLSDEENPWFFGALKIKGELRVGRDLQAGDELTVQVAGPDGEVLTSAKLVVAYPQFKEIKEKGHVIGTTRMHTGEVAT